MRKVSCKLKQSITVIDDTVNSEHEEDTETELSELEHGDVSFCPLRERSQITLKYLLIDIHQLSRQSHITWICTVA